MKYALPLVALLASAPAALAQEPPHAPTPDEATIAPPTKTVEPDPAVRVTVSLADINTMLEATRHNEEAKCQVPRASAIFQGLLSQAAGKPKP